MAASASLTSTTTPSASSTAMPVVVPPNAWRNRSSLAARQVTSTKLTTTRPTRPVSGSGTGRACRSSQRVARPSCSTPTTMPSTGRPVRRTTASAWSSGRSRRPVVSTTRSGLVRAVWPSRAPPSPGTPSRWAAAMFHHTTRPSASSSTRPSRERVDHLVEARLVDVRCVARALRPVRGALGGPLLHAPPLPPDALESARRPAAPGQRSGRTLPAGRRVDKNALRFCYPPS